MEQINRFECGIAYMYSTTRKWFILPMDNGTIRISHFTGNILRINISSDIIVGRFSANWNRVDP